MKRRIAALLTIALLLSLSACREDPVVGDPPLLFTKPTAEEDPTEPSNIVPTQVPTVAPTAAPTQEPTQAPTVIPTEPPTEGPTEPPTVYPIDMDAIRAYSAPPVGYMAFRYQPAGSWTQPGLLDMEEGSLYGIENGQKYFLTNEPADTYLVNVTSEHVYYVAGANRNVVYRTDLHGKDHTVVYETSAGRIFGIDFAGVDANGDLFVGIYDEAGRHRIDMYNIGNGTTQTLIEAARITYFTYVLMAYDPYTGPIIRWNGSLEESDKSYGYNYCFSSGSNVQPPIISWTDSLPTSTAKYEQFFLYNGNIPNNIRDDVVGTELIEGSLYAFDKKAKSLVLVCEDVMDWGYNETETKVFFVKNAQRDQIYAASCDEPSQQEPAHKTPYKEITSLDMWLGDRRMPGLFAYIADGNKIVLWEQESGKTSVMLQSHEIREAYLNGGYFVMISEKAGTWSYERIYFFGMLTASDSSPVEYEYYSESGYANIWPHS